MITSTFNTDKIVLVFQKASSSLLYISAMSPFLWIGSVLAFYFKACNFLGYNPSYNNPDPKDLFFYSKYEYWMDLSFNIWGYAVFIWILVSVITIAITWDRIKWLPVVIPFIGHLIGFFFMGSPIMKWLVD